LLLAASADADTADGLRLLLPLLANAGCIPALCRAPGGVCAWRSLDCCGVLPPTATDDKCDRPWPPALRWPAGLPLLLAALLLGKGIVCGSCALVTKGCFRRRVALARSRATLQMAA
jgi:hypothetical protein